MDERKEFLMEMYRQMMNDINRHIMVVWQSVGVVVGAIALLALSEKQVVPLDVTVALVVLLCGWLRAHLIDAGYWYHRNLVIIGNIERQFLVPADLKEIHNYFGKHPKKSGLIDHLRIQDWLGIGLALVILAYHFIVRVEPGFHLAQWRVDPLRALPYVVLAAVLFWNVREQRATADKYIKFVQKSPGVPIDTTAISYTDSRKDAVF